MIFLKRGLAPRRGAARHLHCPGLLILSDHNEDKGSGSMSEDLRLIAIEEGATIPVLGPLLRDMGEPLALDPEVKQPVACKSVKAPFRIAPSV